LIFNSYVEMRSFVALRPLCYPSQSRLPIQSVCLLFSISFVWDWGLEGLREDSQETATENQCRRLERKWKFEKTGPSWFPRAHWFNKVLICELSTRVCISRMIDESDIVDFEIQNEGMNLAIKKSEALEETVQVSRFLVVFKKWVFSLCRILMWWLLLLWCHLLLHIKVHFSRFLVPRSLTLLKVHLRHLGHPRTPILGRLMDSKLSLQCLDVSTRLFRVFELWWRCCVRAPAPGEPPFAKEGDRVTQGQTVCIIEAMKLMNEIEAEISGEVIKVLVQNGDAITAGQVQFYPFILLHLYSCL